MKPLIYFCLFLGPAFADQQISTENAVADQENAAEDREKEEKSEKDKVTITVSSGGRCKGNACGDLRWRTAPNGCIEITNTSELSISVTVLSNRGGHGKSLSGGRTDTFYWMGRQCITANIYTGTEANYRTDLPAN